VWDIFVEVHGEPATDTERGKYNAVVKKLKQADVTADEYPQLVAAFTTKYRGLQPAPATIAERVGELRHFLQRGPVVSAGLEDVVEQQQAAALLTTQENDYRLGGTG